MTVLILMVVHFEKMGACSSPSKLKHVEMSMVCHVAKIASTIEAAGSLLNRYVSIFRTQRTTTATQ